FDVLQCYLRWQITLTAELELTQIESVFEWIRDLCEVKITLLASSASPENVTANRYTLKESHLETLLHVSQSWQSQLQRIIHLSDDFNTTDQLRLLRRLRTMKRQQQHLQQQLMQIAMRPLAD